MCFFQPVWPFCRAYVLKPHIQNMSSSHPFIRLCTLRHHSPPTNQSGTTSYINRLSVSSSSLQNQASCLCLPTLGLLIGLQQNVHNISTERPKPTLPPGQRPPTTALPSFPANHHTTVPIGIIQWSIQNIHTKSNSCSDTLLPFHSPGENQENLALEFHIHFVK